MRGTDIIAVTADADVFHLQCARSIYGKRVIDRVLSVDRRFDPEPTDREGNEIHPVFASDEIPWDWSCGLCLERIQ
jgi:hypothetical protein